MKRPVPNKLRTGYICPDCRWAWHMCDCEQKCAAPSAKVAPLVSRRGGR